MGVLQKRGSPSSAAVKWDVITDRRPVQLAGSITDRCQLVGLRDVETRQELW